VGIADGHLKIYTNHLRLSELEHIAEAVGAELILLRQGRKDKPSKTKTP
jgi:hypothetical protein